eukprot:10926383-Alexandrium_andersonii.AAC.1
MEQVSYEAMARRELGHDVLHIDTQERHEAGLVAFHRPGQPMALELTGDSDQGEQVATPPIDLDACYSSDRDDAGEIEPTPPGMLLPPRNPHRERTLREYGYTPHDLLLDRIEQAHPTDTAALIGRLEQSRSAHSSHGRQET